MSPGSSVSNKSWYHLEFPHNFFVMFRTGTFMVYPRCDQSVTDSPIAVSPFGTFTVYPRCDQNVTRSPITVSPLGKPQWHPRFTDHVDPQFTAPAHQRFIQGVPCSKPSGFFFLLILDVPSWFTFGTPARFIQDVPYNKPGRVFHPVRPGCSKPVHLRYTGWVYFGCSENFPTRYTSGKPQLETDVKHRLRVNVDSSLTSRWVWVFSLQSLSMQSQKHRHWV